MAVSPSSNSVQHLRGGPHSIGRGDPRLDVIGEHCEGIEIGVWTGRKIELKGGPNTFGARRKLIRTNREKRGVPRDHGKHAPWELLSPDLRCFYLR
jgi:hypothetical protein